MDLLNRKLVYRAVSSAVFATASIGAATTLAAQQEMPAGISWQPDSLVQGSIVRLDLRPVSGSTVLQVTGVVAGEQLHFEVDSTGSYWTLAGLPIDAAERYPVSLTVRYADRTDTVSVRLPVRPRNAPMERLTVAPKFGRPLDKALAARVERERARSRQVSREAHQTPRLWNWTVRAPSGEPGDRTIRPRPSV